MQQTKPSSTFGIIAIVVSIIAFNTPRFLLSIVLIALAAFIIIGFIKDGNKLFSGIALAIACLLFYAMYQDEVTRADNEAYEMEKSNKLYTVKYETICSKCDVSYTNETGGTDEQKDVYSVWSDTFQIKGSQFVSLSVQNSDNATMVVARIYVNNQLIATEQSTGEYKIASVNCRPQDIYDK